MNWFDDFFKSFGPQHGAVAAGGAILGGLINQVLTNRQKIQEIKLSTEEKHFALTLDEASTIRKELRESVSRLEKELRVWQQRYYADIAKMKEENFKLVADIGALRTQLIDIKSRGWIPKDQEQAYSL